MASTAIRGKEGTLGIVVEGRRFLLLTKDFRENPEFEIQKDKYIGERVPRGNPSFEGVGVSWSCDEDDSSALELRQLLMDREQAGLAPPKAQITMRYKYRKAGQRPKVSLFPDCVLAPKQRENPGQSENITNAFEGFCESSPKILTQ